MFNESGSEPGSSLKLHTNLNRRVGEAERELNWRLVVDLLDLLDGNNANYIT